MEERNGLTTDFRNSGRETIVFDVERQMHCRQLYSEPPLADNSAEFDFPHRMGRNYFNGRDGDRITEVIAAAGYNYSLLLRWLPALLRAVIAALFQTTAILHDGSLEASRPIMRG